MNGPGREEKALTQLVRVARQKLDEQRALLADLEAAKASADASLDWLTQAVRAEESAVMTRPQGVIELKRYLEGADEKRRALEATRDRLLDEIASARDLLQDGLADMKKLEHLIEIGRRAAVRRKGKAESEGLDAVAVSRHRRTSGAS